MASETSIRTYGRDAFTTTSVLRDKGTTKVSLIIPAANEQNTIRAVVEQMLVHANSDLLDEIIVVDDGSSDDTAAQAAVDGVIVHSLPRQVGKGGAMTAGVEVSHGELLVFLDGDVWGSIDHYVPSLIGPLLAETDTQLVKGYYDRPLGDMPHGGGRVTALAAQPILRLLYPELSDVRQPLAGETAIRRSALEQVDFASGYQVELALLIDIGEVFGPSAIAEVDLGIRVHRNRPLSELSPMATEVLRVALERRGLL